jgi:hypothetical protein
MTTLGAATSSAVSLAEPEISEVSVSMTVSFVDRWMDDVIAAVVSGIGRCRNFFDKFFRRLAVVGSISRLCVLVGLRFLD